MTENKDWRPFLERWSREWAGAAAHEAADGELSDEDQEALRERWLGFPPASEERVRALEERLGHRLPPSYRTFLAVSDGWRHAGGFVYLLAGTDDARWHQDESGLSEFFPGELEDDPTPDDVLLAGMWERALQLDVVSDAMYVLLDPGDVGDDGEWAVYCYASWRAAPPKRYASFRAFMDEMYREFHRLRVSAADRAGVEFVNPTTRGLDASVEAARLDALAGRYERAEAALAEALAYGRPRAKELRDQIRRLLGETYMVDFGTLACDPVYAPEILPLLAAEHVDRGHDDAVWGYTPHGASDAVRELADEVLRRTREGKGGYRYTAAGELGRAVERAREQARWGETDAAWRTLRAALPVWRPLGPDHLAPVGLCVDPLLGPVLTPERGRELLATPRASQAGEVPVPAAGSDPSGLAWLVDEGPGGLLASYRFVLVESVGPVDLPGRLGATDAGDLGEPTPLGRARGQRRADVTWEDEAVVAVGSAGPDWSFALEARPLSEFAEHRFASPGTAASRGTRAVTVWSDPVRARRRGLFHLSVAEDGAERYAFTVRDGEVTSHGPVPDAFDPGRLFPSDDPHAERLGERRALEALAAEFGVRLPRAALTGGRLHTFRTRPWNRPPAPGETQMYVTVRFTSDQP
ncbi:SMI1/KNR4 family protein [Streptomyces sp. 71268]|uniref:SMI1/KNR4 family protein n=1 Tax=Streptomyces sp. 71268 TaxID=3002640 RepID=UPI0023F798F3|nr:SMI1/KNR4 family protein [Streptomyces sp. 71268]WEV24076.1 SMI1/KNR4 family protein [Streptomyces sp. 71268]